MENPGNRPPLDWDNFPGAQPPKKQKKQQPEYPLRLPCLGAGILIGLWVGIITYGLTFGLGLGMLLGLVSGRLFSSK